MALGSLLGWGSYIVALGSLLGWGVVYSGSRELARVGGCI